MTSLLISAHGECSSDQSPFDILKALFRFTLREGGKTSKCILNLSQS